MSDQPEQGTEVTITDLLIKIGSLTVELDVARADNARLREQLAEPPTPGE